jgi:hypothetical protein
MPRTENFSPWDKMGHFGTPPGAAGRDSYTPNKLAIQTYKCQRQKIMSHFPLCFRMANQAGKNNGFNSNTHQDGPARPKHRGEWIMLRKMFLAALITVAVCTGASNAKNPGEPGSTAVKPQDGNNYSVRYKAPGGKEYVTIKRLSYVSACKVKSDMTKKGYSAHVVKD